MIRFSYTLAFQHDSVFSPFKAHEFDSAIDWAASSGLDGVELVISDYSSLPFSALRICAESWIAMVLLFRPFQQEALTIERD